MGGGAAPGRVALREWADAERPGNCGKRTARLTAANCVISGNSYRGVEAVFTGATAYLDNCQLSNNVRGLYPATGGQIISLGNNTFTNNGTNGTFSSTTPRF